jgi:hypothetical protein
MAHKRRFPMLAMLLLIFAVVWLLNDLKVIALDIPWIPVILIIIAIGMIYNRYLE